MLFWFCGFKKNGFEYRSLTINPLKDTSSLKVNKKACCWCLFKMRALSSKKIYVCTSHYLLNSAHYRMEKIYIRENATHYQIKTALWSLKELHFVYMDRHTGCMMVTKNNLTFRILSSKCSANDEHQCQNGCQIHDDSVYQDMSIKSPFFIAGICW